MMGNKSSVAEILVIEKKHRAFFNPEIVLSESEEKGSGNFELTVLRLLLYQVIRVFSFHDQSSCFSTSQLVSSRFRLTRRGN
jgi:hypothetical protein